MPRVLIAPDKWRGTATALQVAEAVGRGARLSGWEVDLAPVSDGGEGFLEVMGGVNRSTRSHDSRGRRVEAGWRLEDGTAVIESARVCGLTLAGGPGSHDALAANTRGVGEVVAGAIAAGARRIIVGLGGSATTDGGLGFVEVMRGEHYGDGVELIAACDVSVPFAEAIGFAAQKGATGPQIELLRRRLERVAQIYESEFGVDVRALPGAGAAGGLGGGLAAFGALLLSGIDVVAEALGLEERLAEADLVVTGEGCVDDHSFEGKVVGGIAEMARRASVPVLVIAGESDHATSQRMEAEGMRHVELVEAYGPERARSNTLECIEAVIEGALAQ